MDTTPLWLGGIGAALGGVGAAAGAIAATVAARSSFRAAAEARDAVALTVRPSVEAWVGQWEGAGSPAAARVWVRGRASSWAATDVLVQFTLASGKTGSTNIGLLEPNYDPGVFPERQPFLNLNIATMDEDWPPPGGEPVDVVVLFSDVRRAARYRLVMAATFRRLGRGSVSFELTKRSTTERIP